MYSLSIRLDKLSINAKINAGKTTLNSDNDELCKPLLYRVFIVLSSTVEVVVQHKRYSNRACFFSKPLIKKAGTCIDS